MHEIKGFKITSVQYNRIFRVLPLIFIEYKFRSLKSKKNQTFFGLFGGRKSFYLKTGKDDIKYQQNTHHKSCPFPPKGSLWDNENTYRQLTGF
jgi:hypothetical protein